MRSFNALIYLLLFVLFVSAAGCGKEGTMSGKVFFKGQPVSGGTVYFHPEGKPGNYPSIIQPDGSYSVSKLPRGPARISVLVGSKSVPAGVFERRGGKLAAKGMEKMGKIGKAASGGGDQPAHAGAAKNGGSVPEKYTDPEKSGLAIEIEGGNQTHDIQLTDKPGP